jgi:hypothetical protein
MFSNPGVKGTDRNLGRFSTGKKRGIRAIYLHNIKFVITVFPYEKTLHSSGMIRIEAGICIIANF